MRPVRDLQGQRFGILTVIERHLDHGRKRAAAFWWCICDCGKTHSAAGHHLVSGGMKSCGCRQQVARHGHAGNGRAGKSQSPEYVTWHAMKRRCIPGSSSSRDYPERGIKVCEEWNSPDGFTAFLEHVGPKPGPDFSLDRIDNDRGYEPGNVKWATRAEQACNTRHTAPLGKRIAQLEEFILAAGLSVPEMA